MVDEGQSLMSVPFLSHLKTMQMTNDEIKIYNVEIKV